MFFSVIYLTDSLQPHALKKEAILLDFTSCSHHVSCASSHFWTASFLACCSQDLSPFQPAISVADSVHVPVREDRSPSAGRSWQVLQCPYQRAAAHCCPCSRGSTTPEAKPPTLTCCSAPLSEKHQEPNFLVQLSHAQPSAKVTGYQQTSLAA